LLTDGTLRSLLLVGAAVFFAGVAGSLSLYWSQKLTIKCVRKFHRQLLKDSIARFWICKKQNKFENVRLLSEKHHPINIVQIYTRYCSLCLRILLDGILPFFVVVFSFIFLFYTDYIITLTLIPFALLFVLLIYPLGRKNSNYQKQYLSNISEFNKSIRELIDRSVNSSNNLFKQDFFVSDFLDRSSLAEMLEGFYGRMLSSKKAVFLTQLVLVASIVWLFIFFGYSAAKDQHSWSTILSYLLALHVASRGLKPLSSALVNMGRFLPAVEALQETIYRCGMGFEEKGGPVEDLKVDGGVDLLMMKGMSGERVGEFCRCGALAGSELDPLVNWVSLKAHLLLVPGFSVQECFLGQEDDPACIDRFKKICNDLDIDPNAKISSADVKNDNFYAKLAVCYLVFEGAAFNFIDSNIFNDLTEEQKSYLFFDLKEKRLFICCDRYHKELLDRKFDNIHFFTNEIIYTSNIDSFDLDNQNVVEEFNSFRATKNISNVNKIMESFEDDEEDDD
jgi:ABC-type multidrug transport system fused ATPase/permease subunit